MRLRRGYHLSGQVCTLRARGEMLRQTRGKRSGKWQTGKVSKDMLIMLPTV
jgi:hypothetical protein